MSAGGSQRAFCTLFDSRYVFRAVGLYRSLERVRRDRFELTALCLDEEAATAVSSLRLPRLRVIRLAELEAADPELAAVRSRRSALEYCWTATPCLVRQVLASRPDLADVTYLDADLFFFSDPEPVFAEMGDAKISITPHRFSAGYAYLRRVGTYNVGFVVFRRSAEADSCLDWWRERCLEWCHARLEPGRFGDQHYLDEWPSRFAGVHVSEHPGAGVGPWNLIRHELANRGDAVEVDGRPLVFVHFSGVRIVDADTVEWRPGIFLIGRRARRMLLPPYAEALRSAIREVRAARPGFSAGLQGPRGPRIIVLRALQTSTARARHAVAALRDPR